MDGGTKHNNKNKQTNQRKGCEDSTILVTVPRFVSSSVRRALISTRPFFNVASASELIGNGNCNTNAHHYSLALRVAPKVVKDDEITHTQKKHTFACHPTQTFQLNLLDRIDIN